MRLLYIVSACLGACLITATPRAGLADVGDQSGKHLQLVSDSESKPPAHEERRDIPPKEDSLPAKHELPSLPDLGLDLSSSDVAKRHELDSLIVQPWAPGRGAVGVKVEVTW